MLIDVRPLPAFLASHPPEAAHIPLEHLDQRSHELPWDRAAELRVFDDDDARAASACAALRRKGFAAARPLEATARTHWVEGRATQRLWRGSSFLERVLATAAARAATGARAGLALELACGAGRDAVRLAEHGFEVVALDRMDEALDRVRALADQWEVGERVEARVMDLEAPDVDLGQDRFDWVSVSRFLWRPLFPTIARALRPGGRLCYQTFDVGERDRSGRPRSPKHLLEPGELVARVRDAGLRVLEHETAVEATGRLMQAVLAQKPDDACAPPTAEPAEPRPRDPRAGGSS